jgi:hypothetical protein
MHWQRENVVINSVAAPRLRKFSGAEPRARRLALGLALTAAPQLTFANYQTSERRTSTFPSVRLFNRQADLDQ